MNDIQTIEVMINPNGQDFNTFDYTINLDYTGIINTYGDSVEDLIKRVKTLKDPNITRNITRNITMTPI